MQTSKIKEEKRITTEEFIKLFNENYSNENSPYWHKGPSSEANKSIDSFKVEELLTAKGYLPLLSNCNLQKLNFKNADFSGVNLRHSDFTDCEFNENTILPNNKNAVFDIKIDIKQLSLVEQNKYHRLLSSDHKQSTLMFKPKKTLATQGNSSTQAVQPLKRPLDQLKATEEKDSKRLKKG